MFVCEANKLCIIILFTVHVPTHVGEEDLQSLLEIKCSAALVFDLFLYLSLYLVVLESLDIREHLSII